MATVDAEYRALVVFGPAEVAATIRNFAELVRRDEEQLNAINVFPIADADTGTNLRRTMEAIEGALDAALDSAPLDSAPLDLGSMQAAVRSSALSGRGNSGLIIGQFLAGFVGALDGDLEASQLAAALSAASNSARAAVADPVRGTVLTVAAAAAKEAARRTANDTATAAAYIEVAALGALEKTPSQLQVLADAGVVDSGGAGLVLFFESLAAVVNGRVPVGAVIECRTGLDEHLAPDHDALRGYEVMFRVAEDVAPVIELQTFLSTIGTDVVVASDGTTVAAHVHVADANQATNAISSMFEGRPGAKAISYDVEPLLVRGGESAATDEADHG